MAKRGMGNIRKRKDGRWEASLTVGITATGNPKRKSRYANTKKEAEAKLAELSQEFRTGMLMDSNTSTVNEWLDYWLSTRTGIEDSTRSTYKHELRPLRETLGFAKVQKLKPTDIRRAYIEMTKKGFSQRAQQQARKHFNAALKLAVVEEVIARNPCEAVKIDTPRVSTEKKAQAWTTEEVAIFLDAAKDDPLYPAMYITLTLGLRRGEVLGLTWENVNLKDGYLRINKSYSIVNNKAVLKAVKTKKSQRTIYFSDDVLRLLQELHKENRTGFIFQTITGNGIYPTNLNRSFNRIVKTIPVKRITFHDLRHTYASLALQSGMQVEHVSDRLGHSSVSITLDIYRHLYEAERKEAALSLSDLMNKQVSHQPRITN